MVRVKVMSDLHIDVNSRILGVDISDFESILINHLLDEKNTFDVLVIVGDISNNMLYSLRFLNTVDTALNFDKVIKFVPGNHDVSTLGTILSSDKNLSLYNQSPYSLNESFHLSDKTVLVGGLGWYDYSFYSLFLGSEIDSSFDIESYCLNTKEFYWYDGKKIYFSNSDIDICSKENLRYESLIKEYANKDIFLINHFVPFYRYVKTERNNDIWNTCNAFIGSDNLGNLIESNENVKYVAFGHTHFRQGVQQIGSRKEICVPLGYFGEWSIFEELIDKYDLFGSKLEHHVKEILTITEKTEIIRKELDNIKVIIEVH